MEVEQTAGKWVEKWQLGMRQAGLSGSASAARKYRRASLRVARYMHEMGKEVARLGLSALDRGRVQRHLNRFYRVCRQYCSLPLARSLAEESVRAVWDGLDQKTVGRLALKAWSLVSGEVPKGLQKDYWKTLSRLAGPAVQGSV